ncbi:hypothetical protein [Sorangium sp. So ce854]|uniref:hypothetical protein n=1 Tax=Sorangium sp. So ce854 TaxID=3133322 RepID=UPI003F643602
MPGTICVGGVCECGEPGMVVCCARGEEEPNCFLKCRLCADCADGTAECSGVIDPSDRCKSDAECPGPPDARCGAGRCVDGRCEVEIRPGRVDSQVRGDCLRSECTETGHVVSLQDPYDVYDDGNACTLDICDVDEPQNLHLEDVTCPGTGGGRCHAGACVQCVAEDSALLCPGGLACDGVWCVPGHCENGARDTGLGETGYDCGGPCRPCHPSERCREATDCASGVCTNGSCMIPTCSDGVKNGEETGTDCGARSCPRCPAGQGCRTGSDCTSGVCWSGVCEAPTCSDGVKNADERGVDCGGEDCDVNCGG